jgi:predicted nucleic acid-binding protein
MIKKVFIDADIILDVALSRKGFWEDSRLVLSLVENGIILGFTSSIVVSNIYYVLRKAGGDKNARQFIGRLAKIISILPVDHSDVMNALESKFKDFEDALQHFASLKNRCDYIVTRNTEDYKHSNIEAIQPRELINLFKEKIENR